MGFARIPSSATCGLMPPTLATRRLQFGSRPEPFRGGFTQLQALQARFKANQRAATSTGDEGRRSLQVSERPVDLPRLACPLVVVAPKGIPGPQATSRSPQARRGLGHVRRHRLMRHRTVRGAAAIGADRRDKRAFSSGDRATQVKVGSQRQCTVAHRGRPLRVPLGVAPMSQRSDHWCG